MVGQMDSHKPARLLLPAAKQPADVATGRLATVDEAPADLHAPLGERVDDAPRGAGRIGPTVVLALALGAVDALLGDGVADGLQQAVLAELAGHEVVDAVLQLVDLLDARHLGLVEGVCGVGVGMSVSGLGGREWWSN